MGLFFFLVEISAKKAAPSLCWMGGAYPTPSRRGSGPCPAALRLSAGPGCGTAVALAAPSPISGAPGSAGGDSPLRPGRGVPAEEEQPPPEPHPRLWGREPAATAFTFSPFLTLPSPQRPRGAGGSRSTSCPASLQQRITPLDHPEPNPNVSFSQPSPVPVPGSPRDGANAWSSVVFYLQGQCGSP